MHFNYSKNMHENRIIAYEKRVFFKSFDVYVHLRLIDTLFIRVALLFNHFMPRLPHVVNYFKLGLFAYQMIMVEDWTLDWFS